MPPCPDPARAARRADLARHMIEAMGRDMEGQRELIAARAGGATDAVYWRGPAGVNPSWEEGRRLVELTRQVVLQTALATKSVRRQIARSRVLLDLSRSRADRWPPG